MADNLAELIQRSSSTRQYFLSLPVDVQMKLHHRNEYIRSAYELHNHADYLEKIALISKM